MTLIICISDYWHHRTYYRIALSSENVKNKTYNLKILPTIKRQTCTNAKTLLPVFHVMKRLKWDIDAINFFYLNKELLSFSEYRRLLCTYANSNGLHILWLQIVPPEKDIIDWKWNRILAITLWEKIETEHLMSWLSTLGGAFSALGEQFTKCAEMAGKISMKQLLIGIRLGDPFLQSRCKLFYSLSLIQTGRLRTAKYIIRQQYAFARFHEETDARLVKMCKGIWLKLQYEYELRLKARKKEIKCLKSNGSGDK